MKNEYRQEMDRQGPRQEELDRLYTMIEGGTKMKRKKRLGSRAAAILVCAALTLTVAAAAAVPAVWEAVQTHLGAFAPYAQTIEGAVCTAQGIQLQVLSAISDDLEGRVYVAVQDIEGDRLNEFLRLNGTLTAGEANDPEAVFASGISVVGAPRTASFDFISYDPATKTALFSAAIHYMDSSRPTGKAQLAISGLSTRTAQLNAKISCDSVTGAVLDSLPAGEDDQVILQPDHIEGLGYDNSVLPEKHIVLAPGQTPMDIEGTEDMRISSMGFASDGCFHIRLEFADGVEPGIFENTHVAPGTTYVETGAKSKTSSLLFCDLLGNENSFVERSLAVQETLVEGGMDILFPLITREDLEELQGWQARVYGTHTRSGTDIEGDWSTEFEMEYFSSTVLDWTGEAAGWQVRQVTVSPLSVTMKSNASGGLHDLELCAVKKDGSTVSAEAGTSSYSNLDALAAEAGEKPTEEKGWDAFNTWRFEEPVDVEDIVSLRLGDETIPVN